MVRAGAVLLAVGEHVDNVFHCASRGYLFMVLLLLLRKLVLSLDLVYLLILDLFPF